MFKAEMLLIVLMMPIIVHLPAYVKINFLTITVLGILTFVLTDLAF